uniref:Predicted protein n=1 Tax=Hordeum vulgare subsp. vulgare TaxID=112509 RepID=F2D380_HORVV|nr:predicted protein [Hordeum vulgare subsp. vulgare]
MTFTFEADKASLNVTIALLFIFVMFSSFTRMFYLFIQAGVQEPVVQLR